jgi:hypothetical protein
MKLPVFLICLLSILFFSCTFPKSPVLPTPAQAIKIQEGIDEITANNITNTVLTQLYNPAWGKRYPSNSLIVNYENLIIGFFTAYGYSCVKQPVVCQTPHLISEDQGPLVMNNLIFTKLGTDPTLAPILITAHWDCAPVSPGIDDNGSGCAGVIEIARAIAQTGLTFQRTIIFILFALEEESLIGSSYYAAHMAQSPQAVINFEMIGFTSAHENPYPFTDVMLGFPKTGDFIAVFASYFSDELGLTFIAAAERFVPRLPYYLTVCDSNFSNNPLLTLMLRSDHTPFWERGVPALMLTDTAELRDGTPYHTTDDTIDHINITFLLNVTKAAFATLSIEAEINP